MHRSVQVTGADNSPVSRASVRRAHDGAEGTNGVRMSAGALLEG